MARTRIDLLVELKKVLGSEEVYYSPPSRLKYPCIKYSRQQPSVDRADNLEYRSMNCWMITIIDADPDSDIPNKLKERFKHYLSYDREYTADDLNHFVFTLYF